MTDKGAKFDLGQIVRHRLFDYRGVIFDIDSEFRNTDEWYEQMARTRPPKDRPWYHVMVHDASHTTYVAEQNLEADTSGDPISHPSLDGMFTSFRDGRYIAARAVN